RRLAGRRAVFRLRKPLVIKPLVIKMYSMKGAVRTAPIIKYFLLKKGVSQSECDQNISVSPKSTYWTYVFLISKASRLSCTLLILLKKKKINFLHFYGHITKLSYKWYNFKDLPASGGLFFSCVWGHHAKLYSQFAPRASYNQTSDKYNLFITL
uniref:Elongation of very long chain fatty acids protein n=1 Tax=Anser cygnoides TaxID=8845 RepID=A0A8B9D390_ANSCY